MILLTEKEIESRIYAFIDAHPGSAWDSSMAFGDMCQAQLKKDHDWLMQFEDDIETIGDYWTFTIPNHEIQALKKEAGG